MEFVRRLFAKMRPSRPVGAVPPPNALDAVCAKFGCRYERTIYPTGEVQLMLIRPDATLAATAPTTADAVAAIVLKAERCWEGL